MPTEVEEVESRRESVKSIIKIQDEEFLRDHIEARDYTSYLYVFDIFNEDEMESIDAIPEFTKRNEQFLKILSQKGMDGYRIFKKGLAKRGFLDLNILHQRLETESEMRLNIGHVIVDRAWRESIELKDEQQILNHYDYLVRKIEALNLTSFLATKNVIDGHDMNCIDTLPQPLRNKEFLRIICNRGSRAFMWFIEGLRMRGNGRLCNLLLGRPITASTDLPASDDDDSEEADESDDEGTIVDGEIDGYKEQETTTAVEVESTQKSISNGTNNEHTGDRDGSASDRSRQSNRTDQSSKSKRTDSRQSHDKSDQEESSFTNVQENEKSDKGGNKQSKKKKKKKKKKAGKSKSSQSDSSSSSSDSSTDSSSDSSDSSDSSHSKKKSNKDPKGDTSKSETVEEESTKIGQDAVDDNDQIREKTNTEMVEETATDLHVEKHKEESLASPYQKVVTRMITREPIVTADSMRLKQRQFLLENSIEANNVASRMLGYGLIDKLDVETIRSLRSESQRVRELISLVSWGGSNAYHLFLEALSQADYSRVRQVLTSDYYDEDIETMTEITKRNNSANQSDKQPIPTIIVDDASTLKDTDSDYDGIDCRISSRRASRGSSTSRVSSSRNDFSNSRASSRQSKSSTTRSSAFSNKSSVSKTNRSGGTTSRSSSRERNSAQNKPS